MSGHSDIHLYYYKKDVKFNDTLVIISHPTIGMISSITANFLIDDLDLELIGGFYSDDMYPTAIIHKGRPLPPIRLYAGQYVDDPETDFDQLVVITSELPIDKSLLSPIADKLIEWCKNNFCTSAVTIEGINTEEMDLGGDAKVYRVTTTEGADKHVADMTHSMQSGMVSGLSGVLLYKSHMQNFPLIALLSEAHKEFPDSRSAAAVLEVLNKLVPKIHVDPEPLREQAEKVENQIQKALSQIGQQQKPEFDHAASRGMYA